MESIADQIAAALVRGESAVTPLGTFWVKTYPGYDGRNPRTGAVVPVPDRKLPMLALDPDFVRAALGADGVVPEADDDDEADDPTAYPKAAPTTNLITIAGPSRADAAALLAAGKPAKFPALGRFTRRTITSGPLRGRTCVEFTASQILKNRINGLDLGGGGD